MKKVLILTVTAGNGHNAAANAMKEKLEKQGVQVKVVDILKEYSNKLNVWAVDGGYAFSVGYLRPIYNFFYDIYMKWPTEKAPICPAQASVSDISGKLLKCILEFKPDVIYGTSYYCSMALANISRVVKLPSVNIACMLDYVVSPFWEASVGGIQYLTISHDDFRKTLIEKGFSDKQLVTTGIPISEKFVNQIDKKEARKQLGLDEKLFTVLIFYGGGAWHGGYGVLKQLIKNIKSKLQIVIINGRDEKTKRKIDKKMAKFPKNFVVKNFGFSNQVDVIMSVCDIMIGKGGGLSTTESINKALPLLATEKLPKQEVYNIKFLTDKNLALSFKNKRDLVKKMNLIIEKPSIIEKMHNDLKKMRSNGIDEIAKLILAQPNADYSGIKDDVDIKKFDKLVEKTRKKAYKIAKNK